jgi:hypothetical protein
MKKKFVGLFIFTGLMNSISLATPICDEHIKKIQSAPLCPENSLVLPETYPAMAISLSDEVSGSEFIADFIEKTLRANPESPPQYLLEVSESTMKFVRQRVSQMTADQRLQKKWIQALGNINQIPNSKGTVWHQDFYQASFNPKTGMPTIREIEGYVGNPFVDNATMSLQKVYDSAAKCRIQKSLKISDVSLNANKNGMSGGNIEAAPGGICVVGDTGFEEKKTWDKFTKNACGDYADIIKAPCSPLNVGHVDEIFKTIRIPGKEPCNFALLFASPKKGLELLKKRPNGKAFPKLNSDQLERQVHGFGIGSSLCDELLQKDKASKTSSPKRGTASLQSWDVGKVEKYQACEQKYKNKDLVRLLESQDPEFLNVFQKQMDDFKSQLQKKVAQKFSQCQIAMIDVPVIYGQGKLYSPGEVRTIVPQSTFAQYPSPTNSVSLGDTVIFPEPHNEAFKEYLQSTMKGLNVKSEFIDTLNLSAKGGNVHCASQVIRYCKPR